MSVYGLKGVTRGRLANTLHKHTPQNGEHKNHSENKRTHRGAHQPIEEHLNLSKNTDRVPSKSRVKWFVGKGHVDEGEENTHPYRNCSTISSSRVFTIFSLVESSPKGLVISSVISTEH